MLYNRRKKSFLMLLIVFSGLFQSLVAQTKNVLMFVSYEDTYYSEYIVALKGLEAAGYSVDVRSADTQSFSSYMLPVSADIVSTANSLGGSSYSDFTQQFLQQFGAAWNPAWNTTIPLIAHNGKIQDVVDMRNYDALVIPGGTGIVDYRVDGTYNAQGTGSRLIASTLVQTAAQKLNDLALDALLSGKPVLAQCHGASLPVFWRIPLTSGSGAESIGYSLLKGQGASGFPDPLTASSYSTVQVTHLTNDRVTVSTPHSSFNHNGHADFKIITSADWYPQTIVHATRTLLNILESYPTKAQRESNVKCLVIHGGHTDSTACSASFTVNDVPCNYGSSTANLPADYRHVQNLLNANSPADNFNITCSELNLSGTLPYTGTSTASILSYLQQYDVVVFFKHWSTFVTPELQNALVSYTDGGGGVLAIHHGLYNHIIGSQDKNILVNQLFGVESAMATWSGNITTYDMLSTNYGHFISTYAVPYGTSAAAPFAWNSNPLLQGSNTSFSTYQRFSLYDEIYNNMSFLAGQTFGRNVNQVYPLFSNDQWPASQSHTNAFLKLFNPSADATVGRVAFFQAGETRANFSLTHPFGQVIRNAVVWLGKYANCSLAPAAPSFISGAAAVCPSVGITYSASPVAGVDSYTWSLPIGWSGVSFQNTISVISGAAPATISVSAVNACGASYAQAITTAVNPLPVLSISAGSICEGQSFTLQPTGADSYTFSGGQVVSPVQTSTYSVSGTSSLGCTSANPVTVQVTVHPQPILTTNSGSICSGENFTILPTGAVSYTISGGNSVVSPLSNTSYSIFGTNVQGCVNSVEAVSNVTVLPNPVVTITGDFTVCLGSTATLQALGAQNYNWGFAAGSNVSVSPVSTTQYTVIGTDQNGCEGSAVETVTVVTLPMISASSGTICPGQTYSMQISGGNSYSVSGGSTVVSPVVTTTYSVIGTSPEGCSSATPVISTVTVWSPVLLSISGTTTLCTGMQTTLVANGANSYTWDSGQTSSLVTVSPLATTVYSVTGSNGSCSGSLHHTIQVHPLPQVNCTPSVVVVCTNEMFPLVAGGALSYTWAPHGVVSESILASVSANAIFTLTGVDQNGCENSISISVAADECLGISNNNVNTASAIKVYPVPCGNKVTLDSDEEGNYQLVNCLGQTLKVVYITKGKNHLDLSEYAAGVYFLRTNDQNHDGIRILKYNE